MNVNPKEWHPRHQLDEVNAQIKWLADGDVQIVVSGRSTSQRSDLWRHSEVVDGDESRLVPADHLHHMLLVALQDRPRDLGSFQAGLVGEGWVEEQLPF